ncbi:OmpH family outer membrane protein [Salipiger bermudensis]|uniref:OmpH family outer membrane protein n=1 Tax=Salipiger bermudensis TaxID=344736 RepID=UPI001C998557|nr:OmpH family outer membrane protein [Salipiger bermudensis]MBY6005999.1 OmpH family outer membrane protein [Salipiger bermudensis]
MRRALRLCALALGLGWAAGTASAQDAAPGIVESAILTVEFDRLFSESAYGERVARTLEAEGAEIAAENRRIEAELTAEERALTEKRAELDALAFRELADAFDEKVQALRREQDAKARAIGELSEEERRRFIAAAEPVIDRIMREAGAVVILDKRSVFLSEDVIDITDAAIARIDAAIGDGAAPEDGAETAPAAQP